MRTPKCATSLWPGHHEFLTTLKVRPGKTTLKVRRCERCFMEWTRPFGDSSNASYHIARRRRWHRFASWARRNRELAAISGGAA